MYKSLFSLVPEQLKRMYNLQNGSNDVSIRGSVFEDGDGAGNGSLHTREWQQSIDRRDLGNNSSNWIRLNVGGKVRFIQCYLLSFPFACVFFLFHKDG